MKNLLQLVGLIVTLAAVVRAQTPASESMIVVESPTYTTISLQIDVNRPAEVWRCIGKYCDVGEWLQLPCTITSGTDGEVGAVRSVVSEVLVGRTEMWYT